MVTVKPDEGCEGERKEVKKMWMARGKEEKG